MKSDRSSSWVLARLQVFPGEVVLEFADVDLETVVQVEAQDRVQDLEIGAEAVTPTAPTFESPANSLWMYTLNLSPRPLAARCDFDGRRNSW